MILLAFFLGGPLIHSHAFPGDHTTAGSYALDNISESLYIHIFSVPTLIRR